jgi:NAD(P)-dependent dehydrogenase (short-subunit alcohol dehydrogenase family)
MARAVRASTLRRLWRSWPTVVDTADVQRLFDETKKAFGTIDVLVNNVGV